MKLEKRWHLADSESEAQLTNVELALWQAFHAFKNWQETCHFTITDEILSAEDLSILHIIRMRDTVKTIKDICDILNRADIENIKYSTRKLFKKNLIEKQHTSDSRKNIGFTASPLGIKITNQYANLRKSIIEEVSLHNSGKELEDNVKFLNTLTNLYKEFTRILHMQK